MNRLILVGNGFDLAHGLKTSYHDFIDDFWRKQMEEVQSYNNLSATFENDFIKIDNIYLITPLNNIQKHVDFKNFIQNVNDRNRNFQVSFIIKNKFLKDISDQRGLQNWVDIENEYYKQLYKIKNPINSIGRFEKYEINDLNEDFIEVKSLLVKYLKEIDKTIKVEEKICQSIYKNFSLNDFSSESIADKVNNELVQRSSNLKALEENEVDLNEIFENDEIEEKVIHSRLSSSKNKFENLKDLIIEKENSFSYAEVFNLIPAKITLLNFNYTDTPIKYFEFRYNWNNGTDKLPTFNFIHGKLNDENNPIIFGFGDDVDKKYQEFEDLNDNRYLENFKSIAYLQTDNYKKLLEFINSEDYQVFIFGHSCGISDRTMLNTIFEHENCKSVKPFYHLKKDGSDNYTEIVQNISRNFNDKKKFRDRVVNKTYCEPLT